MLLSPTPARGALLSAALLFAAPFVSSVPPASADVDGAWMRLDPDATKPGPRREHVAILDAPHERCLIFAGWNFVSDDPSGLFREVWSLELGESPHWSLLSTLGQSPGERHSPQMGFDAARQRLIVFGGYGHHLPGGGYQTLDYLNDVWQLDLSGDPTWSELHPGGLAPAPRLAGAAIYDPLRQRFVGFGGTRGLPTDTYVLDLAGDPVWRPLATDSTSSSNGGPPPGYGMTAIYDPVRDRMVMFGGSTSDDYLGVQNDVWALDLSGTPHWTKLEPAGDPPSARRSLCSIYDPVRDRMIVFGGWDGDTSDAPFLHDVWALSLSDAPAWTQLAPDDGALVDGRDGTNAVYDPAGDRMIVFGGWSGSVMLDDTWFLEWGESPPPAAVQGEASASGGVAHVTWQVDQTTGPIVGVYRRGPTAPWSSVATARADANGQVSFADPSVVAGERYAYQLVVSSAHGPVTGGEVWVDVPSGVDTPEVPLSFEFPPVRPNPIVGRFLVSFRLPDAAPARLDVVDVRGRRIWTRSLTELGPGAHQVDLGSARAFGPGLYFVRIQHGDEAIVRRAVIGGSGAAP